MFGSFYGLKSWLLEGQHRNRLESIVLGQSYTISERLDLSVIRLQLYNFYKWFFECLANSLASI